MDNNDGRAVQINGLPSGYLFAQFNETRFGLRAGTRTLKRVCAGLQTFPSALF
jgi:hypothetical protein